jgi:hypothetical protein
MSGDPSHLTHPTMDLHSVLSPQAPNTLVLHTRAGNCIGDMAAYDYFTLGGPYSVRGYSHGELGACRRFVEAAAEVRVPLKNHGLSGAWAAGAALDMGWWQLFAWLRWSAWHGQAVGKFFSWGGCVWKPGEVHGVMFWCATCVLCQGLEEASLSCLSSKGNRGGQHWHEGKPVPDVLIHIRHCAML